MYFYNLVRMATDSKYRSRGLYRGIRRKETKIPVDWKSHWLIPRFSNLRIDSFLQVHNRCQKMELSCKHLITVLAHYPFSIAFSLGRGLLISLDSNQKMGSRQNKQRSQINYPPCLSKGEDDPHLFSATASLRGPQKARRRREAPARRRRPRGGA